ncbi:MAG: hypothetical protein JETT_2124 [Candidatus Jettenia ecosi]|uniref:Uncharacterized protein n=1 Tax=Candidatus Jettenia ecosi TaxID=2494326 RepID=A0A533QAB4_9BACT|nr:MAG: hypothetical protein JETT_2124 [Candidatus Jettenia ecosi]
MCKYCHAGGGRKDGAYQETIKEYDTEIVNSSECLGDCEPSPGCHELPQGHN